MLAAALVLGGCGGGDDDDSASPTTGGTTDTTAAPDGGGGESSDCLLLESQVELTLDIDVDPPKPETAGGGVGCKFEFDGGTGELIIRIYQDGGAGVHDAFITTFDDAEELEVLGRQAAWSDMVGTLDIIDGDAAIQVQIVQVQGNAIADKKQAAIDLAGVVLAGR